VAPREGRRRGGLGSVTPRGWRTVWGLGGRRRRAPVDDVRAGEGMVPRVGRSQRRGAAGERRELGRPVSNSVDF
jgi:hypothetical protein